MIEIDKKAAILIYTIIKIKIKRGGENRMKKKTIMLVRMLVAVVCLGFLCAGIGCELPDGEPGRGILTMNITDAPEIDASISRKKGGFEAEQYEEVYITFTEISVHKADADNETNGGGDNETDNETDNGTQESFYQGTDEDNETDDDGARWIVVSDLEQGFDLMLLQDGAFDLLAQEELEAGTYTQVRLKITDEEDEYEEPKTYVKVDGKKYKLTVPSGTRSGLKLTRGFTITADEETVLYLDFDAQRSVNKTGSGKYMLKPTIKILDTVPADGGGEDNETGVPEGDNETQE